MGGWVQGGGKGGGRKANVQQSKAVIDPFGEEYKSKCVLGSS
jgi:hypothetical protein